MLMVGDGWMGPEENGADKNMQYSNDFISIYGIRVHDRKYYS